MTLENANDTKMVVPVLVALQSSATQWKVAAFETKLLSKVQMCSAEASLPLSLTAKQAMMGQ